MDSEYDPIFEALEDLDLDFEDFDLEEFFKEIPLEKLDGRDMFYLKYDKPYYRELQRKPCKTDEDLYDLREWNLSKICKEFVSIKYLKMFCDNAGIYYSLVRECKNLTFPSFIDKIQNKTLLELRHNKYNTTRCIQWIFNMLNVCSTYKECDIDSNDISELVKVINPQYVKYCNLLQIDMNKKKKINNDARGIKAFINKILGKYSITEIISEKVGVKNVNRKYTYKIIRRDEFKFFDISNLIIK